MAKVYALARVVEDETGLEGYDPQLQEPITDPHQRLGSSSPAAPSAVPPTPATPAAPAPRVSQPPPAKPATGRPWWKFWQS
jgi:hypothetical protein